MYMAPFKVLWRLTLTNVDLYEFLKTKSKRFSPKRKLFLKIWTCETLEIICKTLKNILGVRTKHPKLGVFSKFSKSAFCCFITQLGKKLQQWSLYEVIEDILSFVLNTIQPPERYLSKTVLGVFWKITFRFFLKHQKLFFLSLSNQISLRGTLCIQNERQDILYHLT